jgi:hypothetical protein
MSSPQNLSTSRSAVIGKEMGLPHHPFRFNLGGMLTS